MGKALDAVNQLELDVLEAADQIREAIDDEVAEAVVEETRRCLAWVKSGRLLAEIVEAIDGGLLPDGVIDG